MKAPPVFELSTIQAIPPEHRHGTFRYLFTIWFGCNMSLLTVVTGALATTTFGLGFLSGTCAIVLGLLVGSVFMALHAAQGPQLGLPQMVQTRGQFGALGALLVFAAVILMYVGFIASNLVLGAQSIHSEIGSVGIDTGIVLLGVAGVAVAVFGYDVIHAFSRFVTLATGLALLAMATLLLAGGLPKGFFGTGVFTWPSFVGTFSLAALWALSYAPYVSDYSRYMPKDTGVAAAFWATYLGNLFGSVLPMAFGAALGISLGTGSDLVIGFTRVAGHAALPVIVVFSIGLTCGTAMNLYSCVLAILTVIQTCTRRFSPGPVSRACVCVLIFVVAGTAAIRGQQSFLNSYMDFLYILLYVLVPWTAINLIDYYLVQHGTYDISSLTRADGGVYGHVQWRAMLCYVAGFAIEIPFMSQSLYTGPIAKWLGGADISWIVCLLVISPVYYAVSARRPVPLEHDRFGVAKEGQGALPPGPPLKASL
jgi:NCS1 family nucleobase:cation symporter-1